MEIRFKWEEGWDDPLEAAENMKEDLEARGIDSEVFVIEGLSIGLDPEEEDDYPEYLETALVIYPRKEDRIFPAKKPVPGPFHEGNKNA